MRFFAALLLTLSLCSASYAAPKYPALLGRVVDNAGVLSTQSEQSLTQILASHEAKTTNQVVVVTLKSLEGRTIEEYGVGLGRYWGIGQKGKNNGALFIIVPNERETRIEVGYGLEGTLTDALNSMIIQQIVLPRFKNGQMEHGIIDGTTAIVSTLEGKQVTLPVPQPHMDEDVSIWLIIAAIIVIFILRIWLGVWIIPFGGSGRSGGGGFSGGGGSFGGGGSSGKW